MSTKGVWLTPSPTPPTEQLAKVNVPNWIFIVVEIFACTTLRMSNKNVTRGARRIENVNWIFQRLLTIMMRMMFPINKRSENKYKLYSRLPCGSSEYPGTTKKTLKSFELKSFGLSFNSNFIIHYYYSLNIWLVPITVQWLKVNRDVSIVIH